MDILYLMILCSVSLAAIFLVVFIMFARKGQFEDDESPAVRILFDDEVRENPASDLKNFSGKVEEKSKTEEKSE